MTEHTHNLAYKNLQFPNDAKCVNQLVKESISDFSLNLLCC